MKQMDQADAKSSRGITVAYLEVRTIRRAFGFSIADVVASNALKEVTRAPTVGPLGPADNVQTSHFSVSMQEQEPLTRIKKGIDV